MLEILQFYVSGFWVWLGLTVALGLVVQGVVSVFGVLVEVVRKK